MVEEKKENRKIIITGIDILLIVIVIAFFISLFVSSILDSQRQIAEKQYLASITPEERQHLQLLQEQKDAAAVEGSKQFWANAWSVIMFPLPFGFLFIFFIVMWFVIGGRKRRWL